MFPGKVPPEILEKIVFSNLGVSDPSVLLGPKLGEDASIIQIDDKAIIASTDPITGSVEDIGWLAVHVNANDIATFGIRPRWLLISILLPNGSDPEDLRKIMNQIDEASRSLGIAVVGGHSEITEKIDQPIVVGFMVGLTEKNRFVTSKGAKPGDSILMTKAIGIEGTAILAKDGYKYLSSVLQPDLLKDAVELRRNISVVEDGVTAFNTGHIHAMHDPTEGGLAGGIHEMSDASSLGFELYYDEIPLNVSTKSICQTLDINPLELICSGSMLMSCSSQHAKDVIEALQDKGIPTVSIGTFVSNPSHRKISIDNEILDLPRPKNDALWDALRKINLS